MPSPTRTTAGALASRLATLWWLKAAGTTLFMWLFFSMYFSLQQLPHAFVSSIPLTWLDAAVPMQRWAWLPYLSLWVYTSLPAALQPRLRSLLYYGFCIALVCAFGLLCYYFWPTAVPPLDKPEHAQLSWLRGVDTAGNACPSLHVASALFSWLWLRHLLRQVGAGRGWHAANAVWVALIVYSTLATKQHVAWDVVAGLLLGAAAGWLSLWASRRMPAMTGFGGDMIPAPQEIAHNAG